MTAKYKVTCPGQKTAYFTSFMGAYAHLINALHGVDILYAEDAPEHAMQWVLQERHPTAGWQIDHTNTNEALREVGFL